MWEKPTIPIIIYLYKVVSEIPLHQYLSNILPLSLIFICIKTYSIIKKRHNVNFTQ